MQLFFIYIYMVCRTGANQLNVAIASPTPFLPLEPTLFFLNPHFDLPLCQSHP